MSLMAVPCLAAAQTVTFGGGSFTSNGLVGVARVPSNALDQFGDTLGGFGSGMVMDLTKWRRVGDSYTSELFMLPDRGWNTQGTLDYQGRLQRFALNLSPYYGSTALPAGPAQQNQLQLALQQTLGLTDSNGTPTTGLDPTGVRAAAKGLPDLPIGSNGRVSLDNEAVVRGRDGSFWISDEYGPYIYRYNSAGQMIGAIRPPDAFIPIRSGVENFSSNNPPAGTSGPAVANPTTGRQNNQGFEGLAISANGRTLTTLLQSATRQDGGTASSATRYNTRMLTYDISNPDAPALISEYVVQLPRYFDPQAKSTLVAAQSEMLQLNSHQFLVLARDSGHGYSLADPTSIYRSIDIIDTNGATNIANTRYDGTTAVAPGGNLVSGVTPVQYQAFININDNSQLARFGLHNGGPSNTNDLYEKWESMSLVPTLNRARPNDFFLLVGSDNDFVTQNGVMQGKPYADASGANVDTMVLVYLVTLPTYIDPLALESLEVTALPLARATGDTTLQLGRTVAGLADNRVFALRATAGDLAAQNTERFHTYVNGNFNIDSQGGSGSTYAYGPAGGSLGRAATDPSIRSATVGADYRVSANLRAGLSLTYLDSTTNLGGGSESRITTNGAAISPYVTAFLGSSWVDLQYSYIFTDYDIRRDTGIYGLTARGKPNGDAHLITAAAGHNFSAGPVVFGPAARLSYLHAQIDGYTEQDAILANAAVPKQSFDNTTLYLGSFVSYPFQAAGLQITPQVRAGYNLDLSGDNRTMTIGLSERAGMPDAQVTGPVGTLGTSGFHGGAGVSFRRDNISLLVDYDVQTRTYGTVDHLVSVSLGMAF